MLRKFKKDPVKQLGNTCGVRKVSWGFKTHPRNSDSRNPHRPAGRKGDKGKVDTAWSWICRALSEIPTGKFDPIALHNAYDGRAIIIRARAK